MELVGIWPEYGSVFAPFSQRAASLASFGRHVCGHARVGNAEICDTVAESKFEVDAFWEAIWL